MNFLIGFCRGAATSFSIIFWFFFGQVPKTIYIIIKKFYSHSRVCVCVWKCLMWQQLGAIKTYWTCIKLLMMLSRAIDRVMTMMMLHFKNGYTLTVMISFLLFFPLHFHFTVFITFLCWSLFFIICPCFFIRLYFLLPLLSFP